MNKTKLLPEAVVAYLIFNKKGDILLNKSTKWGNYYVLGGGHIEYGEEIMEAVKREAREEVGLKVKPLYCVNIGEYIKGKSFHRPIHMLYLHIACRALTNKIKVDGKDITEAVWINPHKALSLKNLDKAFKRAIKNYIEGVKLELNV